MASNGEVGGWPVAGRGPAPGRYGRVIEIDRDTDWRPPEPRPWSTQIRIIAAASTIVVAAGVYFAGIARPASLAPTFQRTGTAEAMALDGTRAYVYGPDPGSGTNTGSGSGSGTNSGKGTSINTSTSTSTSTNSLRAYRLDDGTQLWDRRVVGLGTLLVLGGDRLAVATVDVGQRPLVEVLDARTGGVVWQRQTRFVARAGDLLVVNGPLNGDKIPLRGLVIADGSPRWTVEMEPTAAVAGIAGPLDTDQVEVLPGHLRVRDLTSGRIVVDVREPATATKATVVGGTALIVDQAGVITAHDAGDGRFLWRQPSPVIGIFSGFGDCGRYICHLNDRGTIALDRLTGRRAWKADKRYLSVPVDEEHMFVAETFEGFDGPGTAVVDPRNGQVRAETAPWRALGVIDGPELLVWRYDGPRRQLIGLFDARTARTRVIGSAPGWTSAPTCVVSPRHVLCANTFDFAAWPR